MSKKNDKLNYENLEDINEDDKTITLDDSDIANAKLEDTSEKTLDLSGEDMLEDKFDKPFPVSDDFNSNDDDELTDVQRKKLHKTKEHIRVGPMFKYFFIAIYFLLMILVAFGGLFALSYFYNIYNNDTLTVNNASFYKSKQSTAIYDQKGELITSLSLNYVDWVDLEEVPDYYEQAVVATEDGSFYTHGGIDYDALVKGVINKILGRGDRGGSTITMQLGKIIYMEEWYLGTDEQAALQDSQPIEYKLLQMSYALKIESLYTKDQILENYVNSVNYGKAYGIENASIYYFGHGAKDLTLSESMLLAGLPQSPNAYNPYVNTDAATARRNDVVDSMVRQGNMTEEEAEKEKKVEISSLVIDESQRTEEEDAALVPYLDVVQRELNTLLQENVPEGEEGDAEVTTGESGLKVYTYLDVDLQTANYNSGSIENSEIRYQDEYIQVGMTQLDTQNGAIYSLINGRGSRGRGGTNFAYNYPRQPGSTAKPLIDYAPAIEYLDWSTYHAIDDSEIKYRGTSTAVGNSSGSFSGSHPMQYHLGHSNNTPALRAFYAVVDEIGYNDLGEWLVNLGITDVPKASNGTDDYFPFDAMSIGGWTTGTTPMEMAGAYAAFGNGGVYNEPHTINYIEVEDTSPYIDILGDRYEYEYESHQAMGDDTAYLMTKMMDVDNADAASLAGSAANGPKSYDYDLGHYGQSVPSLSAKTGTTNWDTNSFGIPKGTQKDRWVVGYTKDITTAVWTGYEAEYEAQGYYPSFSEYGTQGTYNGGNDAYELFHVYTWNANDATNELFHDAPEIVMPSNVYEENHGGIAYYFINESDDANALFEPPVPELGEPSISGTSATFKWTYEAADGISFNVYIDGKIFKTTNDSSITITQDDFNKVGGCKASYTVTVSSSIEGKESDQSGGKVVNYSSDAFCKTPAASNDSSSGNSSDKTTPVTPPTSDKPITDDKGDSDSTDGTPKEEPKEEVEEEELPEEEPEDEGVVEGDQ